MLCAFRGAVVCERRRTHLGLRRHAPAPLELRQARHGLLKKEVSSELMSKSKTRLLALLILPVVLGACATQEASQDVITADSESAMQCLRSCEYIHGGTVRGCSAQRSGATRAASLVEACVDDAYAALRACYRTCE